MSLYQDLVNRNMHASGIGVAGVLSLESAAIAACDVARSDIEELHAINEDSQRISGEIHQGAVLSSGIDNLIDDTIEAYGKDGIDERGAELMRLSVEALIRASGLPLHIDAVVPSFEKGVKFTDYSVEAEEKKNGIIQRLLSFLRSAWERLTVVVKRYYDKLRTSTTSLETYVKAVDARVGKLSGATPDKTIKINEKIALVLAGEAPGRALTNTVTTYAKFTAGVQADLGAVGAIPKLSLPASEAQVGAWLTKLDEALGGSWMTGLQRLANAAFATGHRFEVTHSAAVGSLQEHGTDRTPLVGATAKVVADTSAKHPTEVHFPTLGELKEAAGVAVHSVESLKKVEDIVGKWISGSTAAVGTLKLIETNFNNNIQASIVARMNTEQNKKAIAALKSHMAANDIFGKAYTLTLPIVMDQIRTVTRFVDSCSSHVAHAALKDVKSAGGSSNPRLTHQEGEHSHEYTPFTEVKSKEHA